jgi:hypothetical protein
LVVVNSLDCTFYKNVQQTDSAFLALIFAVFYLSRDKSRDRNLPEPQPD